MEKINDWQTSHRPLWKITLIRVAPRKLDVSDNLPMAFKHIKDYISSLFVPEMKMGRADELPCFEWQYGQEKGAIKEYAMVLKIETL